MVPPAPVSARMRPTMAPSVALLTKMLSIDTPLNRRVQWTWLECRPAYARCRVDLARSATSNTTMPATIAATKPTAFG